MATYANISIDQGSDFELSVPCTGVNGLPLNLTGYTARGQIRRNYSSSTKVDFTIAIPSPTSGTLLVTLAKTTTATMKAQRYVYDIEVTDGSGKTTRILEGQLEINPAVSRSP